MNPGPALRVNGVSKRFRMYGSPTQWLKELLHPMRRKYHREFWALKDITFDIPKGTTFGIIGQNGSGKSTLLQIISGIMQPNGGSVEVNGRISALLELGSGFVPEFTGRDNVFLQGAIMGISREEMQERFDEIAEFAGIGQFMDQPVRTYSSGMFVRLAFAVAINVDPSILIVDEALAVGDLMFQRKCYRKIEDFRKEGKTIIFVSHSLKTVVDICDLAVLLHKGELVLIGAPKDVVYKYQETIAADSEGAVRQIVDEDSPSTEFRYGSGGAEITDVRILDSEHRDTGILQVGHRYTIRVTARFDTKVERPIVGAGVRTLKGVEVIGTNTHLADRPLEPVTAGETLIFDFSFISKLTPGPYCLSAGVLEDAESGLKALDRRLDVMTFRSIGSGRYFGLVDVDFDISVNKSEKENSGKVNL